MPMPPWPEFVEHLKNWRPAGLGGAADVMRDGLISVDELSTYVEHCVPKITKEKWGFEQLPMRDIQGQSFSITQSRSSHRREKKDETGIDCKMVKMN